MEEKDTKQDTTENVVNMETNKPEPITHEELPGTDKEAHVKCPPLLQKWLKDGTPFISIALTGEYFRTEFSSDHELSGLLLDTLYESRRDPNYILLFNLLRRNKILTENQIKMIQQLQSTPEGVELLSLLKNA